MAGVRTVARRALQDPRNLIFDLRPDILDDLGLTLAVRNQANKYLEAAGVQVRLRMATKAELSPRSRSHRLPGGPGSHHQHFPPCPGS